MGLCWLYKLCDLMQAETKGVLFDIFVSYAKRDKSWVKKLVQKLEDNGFSVCWDVRDFDPSLTRSENREINVKHSSVCILIFSRNYLVNRSEWLYYLPYLKSKNKTTVKDLLESKEILCILIDDCDIPDEFSEQVMLDWTETEIRQHFWRKIFKFVKAVKKRLSVKKALITVNKVIPSHELKKPDKDALELSPIVNSRDYKKKPESEQNDNTSIFDSHTTTDSGYLEGDEARNVTNTEEVNDELKFAENTIKRSPEPLVDGGESMQSVIESPNYAMYDNVYPHLISDSFTAEDEDLTKEDINNLTLKMEDIETIMFVNKQKVQDNFEYKNNSKLVSFHSQYEQIKLLDALQNLYERLNNKVTMCQNVLRKNCYKRLISRYNTCIINALNGKKDIAMLSDLPLLADFVDVSDLHGVQCCCCDTLFHSQRALDIHLEECVKSHWIALMR